MTFYENKNLLFDGECLLYRRQTKSGRVNPAWQMRLKVNGIRGYVTRSCKTSDYAKAVVAAKKELDSLHRKVASGLPLKDWTFAKHWHDWFQRKTKTGAWKPGRARWHRGYYDRYFGPYFGDTVLTGMSLQFADAYWIWRIQYWQSGPGVHLLESNPLRLRAKTRSSKNAKLIPSHKTLLMEQSALNEIFADAHRNKRMMTVVKLKVPRGPREDTRRPAFDEDEWKVLTAQLEDWSEGKGAFAQDRLNQSHRRQRKQLKCYVWFLACSGLRVGEAAKLKWADITSFPGPNGNRYASIKVRADTKTGARDVFPMNGATQYLRAWKIYLGAPSQQDLVWSGGRAQQSPLTDANKTFKAFLKRVPYQGRSSGLLEDADGQTRTLYSLRHTYATWALLSGQLSTLDLARNMGTGVVQIEKHYSHVKNHHKAAALTSVALPGFKPDPSHTSPWQIDFSPGVEIGRLDAASRSALLVAAPMTYEAAESLYRLSEDAKDLLPFTAATPVVIPD